MTWRQCGECCRRTYVQPYCKFCVTLMEELPQYVLLMEMLAQHFDRQVLCGALFGMKCA